MELQQLIMQVVSCTSKRRLARAGAQPLPEDQLKSWPALELRSRPSHSGTASVIPDHQACVFNTR